MANGTVGIAQSATPDRQIDNDVLVVGGQTVYRQRVEASGVDHSGNPQFLRTEADGTLDVAVSNFPATQRVQVIPESTSTLYGGAYGTVNVPSGQSLVSIAAHCTVAGSVAIGAVTIPVPAGTAFGDQMPDAAIPGPLAIVFTGTDSYYVRTAATVT